VRRCEREGRGGAKSSLQPAVKGKEKRNHRHRLQDQTQVLEDSHQALEEDARMWQDYVQTLREHLHVMENLSPDSTKQGVSHESDQVRA
jgi:hypothetical protein